MLFYFSIATIVTYIVTLVLPSIVVVIFAIFIIFWCSLTLHDVILIPGRRHLASYAGSMPRMSIPTPWLR